MGRAGKVSLAYEEYIKANGSVAAAASLAVKPAPRSRFQEMLGKEMYSNPGLAVSRRPLENVFSYGTVINPGEGFDSEKLGQLWSEVYDPKTPLPFPREYGPFAVPVMKHHAVMLNASTIETMNSFAHHGVEMRKLRVADVPGRTPGVDVDELLQVGIRDGAVWNEATIESLRLFWEDLLVPWWLHTIERYLNREKLNPCSSERRSPCSTWWPNATRTGS